MADRIAQDFGVAVKQSAKALTALAATLNAYKNNTNALVSDLWWFIENATDDLPDRTERFFALRERVREHLHSGSESAVELTDQQQAANFAALAKARPS